MTNGTLGAAETLCCDGRTDAEFCAYNGKTCGTFTYQSCSTMRTANCGACSSGYVCNASNTCQLAPETDCGLRGYDGTSTIKFACEPAGTLTSKFRINKNGVTYGVVLVSTADAMASKFRINTSSGIKALKRLP